jgi:hypothetical protein
MHFQRPQTGDYTAAEANSMLYKKFRTNYDQELPCRECKVKNLLSFAELPIIVTIATVRAHIDKTGQVMGEYPVLSGKIQNILFLF